jgi:hypothetical protein
MTGTFNIWLIARALKEPLDISHVRFLWHATITADRSWELPYGKDPFLVPEWKAGGKQTKTSKYANEEGGRPGLWVRLPMTPSMGMHEGGRCRPS